MTALQQQQPETEERPLGRDILYALRYYFGGRWGLIALAAIAVAGGLAFNWSWLVAAGIAPVIVAVLPCAAMCALGLCMGGMGRRAASADGKSEPAADSCCTPAADKKEEEPHA